MTESGGTLYVDLDGTLLDIRAKYYALYSRTVSELGASPLEPEAYWALKRRAAPPEEVLAGLDAGARKEFSRRWLAAIETPSYTRLDTLLPGAAEALADLVGRFALVLATMRHDEDVLRSDLRRLDIDRFFSLVVTANGRPAEDSDKGRLIRRHRRNGSRAFVIGDSEADVRAARDLVVPVVCVLTGIRDRPHLEALSPDHIIESVAQLPGLLEAI